MARKKQTNTAPVEVLSLTKELQNFAHEHHLNELVMIEQIENSLAKSYKKKLRTNNDLIVTIDRTNDTFYVYEKIPVGEPDPETGEYIEFEEIDVTPEDKSRFAALNLKPVLKQIIDEANKKNIYEEFSPRIGEIIYGTVVQDTKNFAIIKIRNGVEAELPHYDKRFFPDELDERPNGERYYKSSEPLAVMILDVRNPFDQQQQTARSRPMIVVTRKRVQFVEALMREYIPEIDEGLVAIKRIVRDAGNRTKIAVAPASMLSDVDPVGACVGPRGSRIKDISAEMQNERVEIVRWSDDPGEYVKSALGLRREGSAIINYEAGLATVIVPDTKLSATIGKNGENARLAANLTGWKIDIKSESYVRKYGGYDIVFTESKEETGEPEFDGRCAYSDAEGRRCRNAARPGSHYCSLHNDAEEAVM